MRPVRSTRAVKARVRHSSEMQEVMADYKEEVYGYLCLQQAGQHNTDVRELSVENCQTTNVNGLQKPYDLTFHFLLS